MNGNRPIEVAAGHGAAFPLAKGQAARLINTHGTQVVDCWAWNAADLTEHMSMEASRVFTQRLNPIVGDSFVTTKRRPILTLVEDTSPGIHDTFMAACDRASLRIARRENLPPQLPRQHDGGDARDRA